MAGKYEKRALAIVKGMEPWWRDINGRKKGDERDGRTLNECSFDSGIFAAAEFMRRFSGDEDLCLAIHELCFWARKQREQNDGKLKY